MNLTSNLRLNNLLRFHANRSIAQLVLFVTARCNARCKTCFYWKNIDKADVKNELTLNEIKKISQNMDSLFWVLISGGEPFLRNDIDEICELFYKNNNAVNYCIPTNGLLPGVIKSKTRLILEKCPDANIVISLSIDDLDENLDRIKGVKNAYKKAEQTAHVLIDLKKDYKNLALAINIVMSSFNQHRIKHIYDFLEEKFSPDHMSVALARGKPRNSDTLNYDINNYALMQKYIIDKQRYKHYLGFFSKISSKKDKRMAEIFVESIKNNRKCIDCLAGYKSIVVTEHGDVYPCELIDKKMGNVRDFNYDVKEILKTKISKEIVKEIKKSNCFCTWECAYVSNILLSKKELAKFLKPL